MGALNEFDPALSARVANVLHNPDRLNIVEVAASETNMMQCRPAGVTMVFIKAAGLYIPDFAEKFGPRFTRQDNPADHSIIDFEYDGAPRSVVWLAHELGHAIADDIQRENGHSYQDNSPDEAEEQAYFVQHIVSRHMKENLPQHIFQDDDLENDPLAMSRDRARQYIHAGRTFDVATAHKGDERTKISLKALDPKIIM